MAPSPLVVTEVSGQGVLDKGVDGDRLSLSTPIAVGSTETFPPTLLHFPLKLPCDQNRVVGENQSIQYGFGSIFIGLLMFIM